MYDNNVKLFTHTDAKRFTEQNDEDIVFKDENFWSYKI